MTSRYRNQDHRHSVSGTYSYWTGFTWHPLTGTMSVGTDRECWDEVGEWERDNSLITYHRRRQFPQFWGVWYNLTTGLPQRIFSGYPIQKKDEPKNPESYFVLPNTGQLNALALEAVAKTNPSTPHLSLPTFIGELKDLPGMLREIPKVLRDRGRSLIANPRRIPLTAANANLSWRFGWKPLIGDVCKMLNFSKAVERRLALLRQLRSQRSIKRRHMLPLEQNGTPGVLLTTHSSGILTKHVQKTLAQRRSWIAMRWSVDAGASLPPPNSWQELLLAWRLVTGFTTAEIAATAWELLPWSWLVDWYWNFGSWLSSVNGTLPLTLASVCYCATSSCMTTYDLALGPDQSSVRLLGDYYASQTRKRRIPVDPSVTTSLPSPTLPVLTRGQWSILASVITQRLPKKVWGGGPRPRSRRSP